MRFLIMVKATKESEAGVMPEEKLMAEMAQYHEELVKAGVLLDASGMAHGHGVADQVLGPEAHAHRRSVRRDEGAPGRLHAHQGALPGGSDRVGEALP